MKHVRALIGTWLFLDFFGDARRSGGTASSLTTTIFAQSFLAFVFAALLYPDTPPVPFAAANLCLSTLLVATAALGDGARPNRRAADDVLLLTAPVRPWQVTIARAGHAAFHLMLVTVGMALPPAILLTHLRGQPWLLLGYLGCACLCTALATGALALAARAGERWLGTARTNLLLGTLKAGLLGGGLVLFALGVQRLQGTPADLPIGSAATWLLPPWHCARWLSAPVEAAPRLLALLAVGALLLLAGIALGSRRSDSNPRIRRARTGNALLRALAGDGPRRGLAEFVAVTMWRSPGFRARVLPLLGLPAGMAFLTMRGEREDGFVLTCVLLQLPAIYLPFLVAFLPRSDQPGTGWVFDQAPGLTPTLVQDATWRALVSHVLLPVHALAIGLLSLVGPSPLAAIAASVFALGVGIAAARWQVRALPVVPFTQPNEADGAADLGGAFAGALLLGGLGALFGAALPAGARWPIAILVLLASAMSLYRRPRRADENATALVGGDPSRPPDADDSTEPHTAKAPGTRGPSSGKASLVAELRAILVLYAAVAVLPWLVGTMFAA